MSRIVIVLLPLPLEQTQGSMQASTLSLSYGSVPEHPLRCDLIFIDECIGNLKFYVP